MMANHSLGTVSVVVRLHEEQFGAAWQQEIALPLGCSAHKPTLLDVATSDNIAHCADP